jgi:hypothetical protein
MGVLLMLMTIGGLTVAAVLLVIAVFTKKAWLRNFVFGAVALWFVLYAATLIGTSVFSKEKTLAVNEPKAFCGFYLDCHMHTAVTGVRRAKAIGGRTANGEFYIVKVKVFSDAVKATLALTTVETHVVDSENRMYIRDTGAESQLGPQPAFEKVIGPEEEFEKEIVFDLPVGVKDPRLDLRQGFGIEHVLETFLIGDEDSILHKRAHFKLVEQIGSAGVK